jgi:hypothetical protein
MALVSGSVGTLCSVRRKLLDHKLRRRRRPLVAVSSAFHSRDWLSSGTLVEAYGAALSHDCGWSLAYPRCGSTRRARARPSPYSTMIGPATNDWVTGSMLGVTMAATTKAPTMA